MPDLAQNAISSALKGNWKEAKKLNLQIVETSPKDADALNRLARAYIELGSIAKAKSTARAVLKIDPFNSIATKSIKKWKNLKKNELTKGSAPTSPEVFLEEPGKTKEVVLINLGEENILGKLDAGDEVRLSPKNHKVSIITKENKYVGRLPDDIASRIRRLCKIGNKYRVLIKSTEPEKVKVFIREVKRSPKVKNVSTFSTERIDYISFTPPELIHSKSTIQVREED